MHCFPQFTCDTLWWEFAWVGAVQYGEGEIFFGGNFPRGAIILGGNCPGEGQNIQGTIFLKSNCPRTVYYDVTIEISSAAIQISSNFLL